MSPEIDTNTILSGVAALGTLGTATTIYLTIRYERRRRQEREEDRRVREEDRRIAKEQLNLAHQEALRNPILEVSDVSLTVAEEVNAKVREAKAKWRELQRELQEDLEANPPVSRRENIDRRAKYMRANDVRYTEYDGPFPDLILTFELCNLGKKAAHEVSITVRFESLFLKPIEFPKLAGKVRARDRASVHLSDLPPSISGEGRKLSVALLKRGSGKTKVSIVCSTPDRDYLERSWDLVVP